MFEFKMNHAAVQIILALAIKLYRKKEEDYACFAIQEATDRLRVHRCGEADWAEHGYRLRQRVLEKIEGWTVVEDYLREAKGKTIVDGDATCRRFRYKLLRELQEEYRV